jgi:3D-(3,5/4)-trihydroxycyclohexane-1,2-dione acylhydrolase (decyclizing)
MGYEVAGGLGVKIAEPDSEVWVLVGDGSYLMMHSEIVTALCEDLKVNIILFDSFGFNCIKSLQKSCGSEGFGTDLVVKNTQKPLEINYSQYAEALGLTTFSPKDFKELTQAILKAQQTKNSTLIEVKVLQGSQTIGYNTWWNVGVSALSRSKLVQEAYHKNLKEQTHLRPY